MKMQPGILKMTSSLSKLKFNQVVEKEMKIPLYFFDLLMFLKENGEDNTHEYLWFCKRCVDYLRKKNLTVDSIPRTFDQTYEEISSNVPSRKKEGWVTRYMRLQNKIINFDDLKKIGATDTFEVMPVGNRVKILIIEEGWWENE